MRRFAVWMAALMLIELAAVDALGSQRLSATQPLPDDGFGVFRFSSGGSSHGILLDSRTDQTWRMIQLAEDGKLTGGRMCVPIAFSLAPVWQLPNTQLIAPR